MKTNKRLRLVFVILFASAACLMAARGQQPVSTQKPGRASNVPARSNSSAGVYNIRAFGARGDGHKIDTPAINKAIEAAAAAGGGTVLFPAGDYLSVSIHLKSNVTLY